MMARSSFHNVDDRQRQAEALQRYTEAQRSVPLHNDLVGQPLAPRSDGGAKPVRLRDEPRPIIRRGQAPSGASARRPTRRKGCSPRGPPQPACRDRLERVSAVPERRG